MRSWTFMQWVIAVVVMAGMVAIVLIALPAMGIAIPAWAVAMFWAVVIVVVAIAAIAILWRVWNSWGGGTP